MKQIACFISPHGFGHATRTIAIVEALQRLRSDIHVHFFTTVARSLFGETLADFSYHPVPVDIGLVQSSAMEGDIGATIGRLDSFYPPENARLEQLALLCADCAIILCDIAPLGIAVAKRAGVPSVLVENFTWDWIYRSYLSRYPRLEPHARYLNKIFSTADYRIQTEPLCCRAGRDLYCGPIFRRQKKDRDQMRQQLGVGDRKLVVVTMGGIFQRIPEKLPLARFPDIHFLFAGQRHSARGSHNITLISGDSGIYHPDLLAAADVVVTKAGYSTAAECCQAGARVISVGRDDFPETAAINNFLTAQLASIPISHATYQNGDWMDHVLELLSRPDAAPCRNNGADAVASFLDRFI